jgi:LacI family transcriptional regulator
LREQLDEAGFHLEVRESRAAFGARPERALAVLAQKSAPAGWVLYQSTAALQHWLSERGWPGVITGSRHEGVRLPSVDLDYRAACRHAAGLFSARGHCTVALLNPGQGLAGDRESEAGFLEGFPANPAGQASGLVVQHDGTVEGICRRLDALLARPQPPTALLVSKPHHVLTVMSHLALRRVRIPEDLALISRDHESFLDHVLPSVTRYVASPTAMAQRVSRLVLEMVRSGLVAPEDHRIMPAFKSGATLGGRRLP